MINHKAMWVWKTIAEYLILMQKYDFTNVSVRLYTRKSEMLFVS